MADNASLGAAKSAKNDEFYTQYSDIEAEMNAYVEFNPDVFRGKTILLPCDDPEWSNFTKYFAASFERFGLKKLISTSYAKGAGNRQLTIFEMMSPLYDEEKHETRGKLFTLTHDRDGSGMVDTDDIEFSGYLEGDGDFRSAEVCKLRDEADIIITNPPFSMFHEFIDWVFAGKKRFVVLGQVNAIKYREVFPRMQNNEIWVGDHFNMTMEFVMSDDYELKGKAFVDELGKKHGFVPGMTWFTNIDFAARHEPILLDTMAHNLKFNKQLKKKLKEKYHVDIYPKYSNYDALEVPFSECIPSDYDGVMGVPITFLGKYDPNQFEIVGMTGDLEWATKECDFFCPPDAEIQAICKARNKTWRVQKVYVDDEEGLPLVPIYDRLFICHKKGGNA